MGDPANEHHDDPHEDDDHDESDEPLGPPPDRLDRVWLHPTELPPPPKPRKVRNALFGMAKPLAIGALGAVVAVGVLAAVGTFDDEDPAVLPLSQRRLNEEVGGTSFETTR